MKAREKRIVRDGYDHIAEAYAAARKELSPRDEKYLKLLSPRIPAGAKVLDLGCGSGVGITKFLAERFSVTGVDISPKQIELARRHVPEATFLIGDMTEMSFPDETFDAACSILAIIHVPRERHGSLFRRLHRTLKPGGLLLVALGADDWVSPEDERFLGVPMYWSQFGIEENKRIIEGAGVSILHSSVEAGEFQGQHEEHLYILAEKGRTAKT